MTFRVIRLIEYEAESESALHAQIERSLPYDEPITIRGVTMTVSHEAGIKFDGAGRRCAWGKRQ